MEADSEMKRKPTDTQRAEIIAAIRQLADQGHSHGWIVDQLNRNQVPTLSGRKGSQWHKGSLSWVAGLAGIEIRHRPSLYSASAQASPPGPDNDQSANPVSPQDHP